MKESACFTKKNLQLYLRLGLKKSKSCSLIQYKKKKIEAEKNGNKAFYKLMNNAVYGKTMKNLKNRVDVRLDY